jgi:hypothetical protein
LDLLVCDVGDGEIAVVMGYFAMLGTTIVKDIMCNLRGGA